MRRTPDPNETLGEIRNRWALQVGRLLLAFGDIEWVSLECLRTLPGEQVFESAATLPLAGRIALLREILGSRPDLGGEGQKLVDLFGQAKELSRIRNLVSHNPVAFGFYHEESTGDSHMVDEITSTKSRSNMVTFEELTAAAEHAEKLGFALSETYYDIPGELRRG